MISSLTNDSRAKGWHWVILAALLLVATWLRLIHLGSASLWMDEIMSLQLATGWGAAEVPPPVDSIQPRGTDMTSMQQALPPTAILSAVARDTHPPLYFLLLRAWCEVFGTSDATVRLLSVITSILGILALHDAARSWHGPIPALWAAGLMAVAPPQIVYAQETRSYSMLVCLILLQLSALARIQTRGMTVRRAIALSLVTLCAMLTHYTAIPATIALALYVAIELRSQSRRMTSLAILSAAVIFIILWGPTLFMQRQNLVANLAWTADDAPGHIQRTLARLASLPIRLFIVPVGPQATHLWIGAIFYVAALAAWQRREVRAWVLVAGAIIGATTASDLIQHRNSLDNIRFTLAAAPTLFVIAATVGTRLSKPWLAHVVPAAFVLGCAYSAPLAYDPAWKPNARAFVEQLDTRANGASLLVIPYQSREKDWTASVLYSMVTHYSKFPHRPVIFLSKPLANESTAAVSMMQPWMLNLDRLTAPADFAPGARIAGGFSVPYVGVASQLDFTTPAATLPSSP